MSGGHYDYNQWRFESVADQIGRDLKDPTLNITPKMRKEMYNTFITCMIAKEKVAAIDYLLSSEIGEDSALADIHGAHSLAHEAAKELSGFLDKPYYVHGIGDALLNGKYYNTMFLVKVTANDSSTLITIPADTEGEACDAAEKFASKHLDNSVTWESEIFARVDKDTIEQISNRQTIDK